MNDTNLERELLRDLLAQLLEHGQYPELMPFRQRHKAHREALDRLEAQGLVRQVGPQYALTLDGLMACQAEAAHRLMAARNELIPCLRDLYRQDPDGAWAISLLARHTGIDPTDVESALTFLEHEPSRPVEWGQREGKRFVFVSPSIREVQVLEAIPVLAPPGRSSAVVEPLRLAAVEVTGYRPFHGFSAAPGDLTIIIGANATGKSSLFDFLRFVSFAAQMPIPPEIDPRCVGRMLFHAGGDERISFAIEARDGAPAPLRYEAEIQGPVGSAKVVRERLSRAGSDANAPMLHLDFRGGKGSVRDMGVLGSGLSWTVPHNELALRRVLDPRFQTLSRFQEFLAGWRFYGGFDVSPSAPLRRPVHVEESPILAEDGANLSAVLHAMLLERRDLWEELETSLRAAVPGFQTLSVKPKGGKGMVMGTWREEGVTDDLTLADLSDGTLRLLGWLALAFSPSLPPLVCIDEPELGLHPRVLPVLAGALKLASARSQILVATHSPHFLSQFGLSDIAVMRKTDGKAAFVRPDTSEALRNEVAEVGGEALARLFLSEELEVLP